MEPTQSGSNLLLKLIMLGLAAGVVVESHQDASGEDGGVWWGDDGATKKDDLATPPSHQSLLKDGRLYYPEISSSSLGRHLLLVSLLEDPHLPYWSPRCGGHLQMFLPHSLKAYNQPPYPPTCQILYDIPSPQGGVLSRDAVLQRYNALEQFSLLPNQPFSMFERVKKNSASRKLVALVDGQPTFHSMFSYLVTLKEFVPVLVFVNSVYTIIHQREDVGSVIPSAISVIPGDFFPAYLLEQVTGDSIGGSSHTGVATDGHEDGHRRQKRQSGVWGNNYYNMGQVTTIRWNQQGSTTIPPWESESKLWYWREDPEMNANHFHWHQVLSNFRVDRRHRTHSSRIDRRGEMFYFMHKQLLARYNCERMSHGLDPAWTYGPTEWRRPLTPGYQPRLGALSSRSYGDRPSGAILWRSNVNDLNGWLNGLRAAFRSRQLRLPSGEVPLVYRYGVDEGISALGDAIESFEVQNWYGDLHNEGHNFISRMNRRGSPGVMSQHNTALRDPVFFNFHKFIDDVFMEYKNSLGPYSDIDLSFPVVNLTNLQINSDYVSSTNVLYTFVDHGGSVRLNGLDFRRAGSSSSSVRVLYSRLNHMGYTVSMTVQASLATEAMVRMFLIPAGHTLPSYTDITQVAIEMDRFHTTLNRGPNLIRRRDSESPFLARRSRSLYTLQQQLVEGRLSREHFNWGGCGMPRELAVPRGNETGMPFRLIVMLSPLLPLDKVRPDGRSNWSWCGVRSGQTFPDKRPMGFPFDRSPPGGDWRNLVARRTGDRRSNWNYIDIMIEHDPVGVASRPEGGVARYT